MTPVPTEPTGKVYRTSSGTDIVISTMTPPQLIEALYDMLTRKAKHNHKMNKMWEVNETLGAVTRSLHTELSKRNSTVEPVGNLQIAADLGKLSLVKSVDTITIQSNYEPAKNSSHIQS